MKIFLLMISLLSLTMTNGEIPPHCETIRLSTNKLAFDIYRTLSHEDNVFFSPLSIISSLEMVYAGARRNTRDEMSAILDLDKNTIGTPRNFRKCLQRLDLSFLQIANVGLVQKNHRVFLKYIRTVRKYFDALFMQVDFSKNQNQTLKEVNEWVANKTNGTIDQVINHIDPHTKLLFLNAVHFNHSWPASLSPENTFKHPFLNNNDKSQETTVDMMYAYPEFNYMNDSDLEAVQLPYTTSHLHMLVVLPKREMSEMDLIMTPEKFSQILSSLKNKTMELYFPMFNIESSKELKQSLALLGMKSAFNSAADFTGISSTKDLYISELVHQAAMKREEKPTDKLHYFNDLRAPKVPDFKFTVDRPFFFYIYNSKERMIYFSGRVNKL